MQAQSATASLSAGEAASDGQAAGAASPPAQKKLAAHETHRPLPSRAKPGWQEQKVVSGETAVRQPVSEQTHRLSLLAPAGEVAPLGHGVQLEDPVVVL